MFWTHRSSPELEHRNREAGGVSFLDLLGAAHKVSGLNIVGCDVNELSPHYDQSGVSTIVACKIVREMLLAFQK